MARTRNWETGAQAIATDKQRHGERDGAAATQAGNRLRRVQGADECSRAPACAEPAVSHGPGMKDALAQRRSDHPSGHHGAEKKGPADSQQHGRAMIAQKVQSLAHLAPEALQLAFGREHVGTQLLRAQHDMAPFAHREVAEKRHDVGGNVDQQNAAQTDVVVHEADDRTGDEPSALHPCQQKRVRVHEPVLRGQFLNEGGDSRPEHPEPGGDQRVHQVELPDLHAVPEGEDGHGHDDHGAQGVEPHDQAPAVFAVNNARR